MGTIKTITQLASVLGLSSSTIMRAVDLARGEYTRIGERAAKTIKARWEKLSPTPEIDHGLAKLLGLPLSVKHFDYGGGQTLTMCHYSPVTPESTESDRQAAVSAYAAVRR